MRRRGFTLLEILVVIAVVLFLIGTMFAVLTKLRSRTSVGQTKSLVEKCAQALEAYNLQYRAYPDAALGGRTGSENLYYFLSTPFRIGAVGTKGEVESSINVGPLLSFNDERELHTQGTKTSVVDSWRNPVVFKIKVIKDGLGFKINVPVVYSMGINGKDEGGDGDDLFVAK